MKEQKYIVIVERPDGSTVEFLSYEFYDVGSSLSGGKVIDCRKLSKKL